MHTARKAVGWAERYGDECGGVTALPMIGKDDTIYGILLDELELERHIGK